MELIKDLFPDIFIACFIGFILLLLAYYGFKYLIFGICFAIWEKETKKQFKQLNLTEDE